MAYPRDYKSQKVSRKLILCFDGTGNAFTGSGSDTNVVKLLRMLDRNDANQYHYYQSGIGTYDVNETSINKTWFGEIQSNISQTIDQGFGTTFDAHVMAGYRFLMRYYESGDKIYIFGFSRGAFTARFLARMVNTVGLLCKGNEEMVAFAFRLYHRYLSKDIKLFETTQKAGSQESPRKPSDADPLLGGEGRCESRKYKERRNALADFSNTFCRKEMTDCGAKDNNKVFFLGMWDCVNSVALLEQKASAPMPVKGTAVHVRHAVAVDEFRVKFKPALLAQDIRDAAHDKHSEEDIKEVWFPGNHGDVGGGWSATHDNPTIAQRYSEPSLWKRFKTLVTRKGEEFGPDDDPAQLSDIPLAWMIRQLELIGEHDESAQLAWRKKRLEKWKVRFQEKKKQALNGFIHNLLRFGYGMSFFKVLGWHVLEWLPFVSRYELTGDGRWVRHSITPNHCSPRDIPVNAALHESLHWRLHHDHEYCPQNNHGGLKDPCFAKPGKRPSFIHNCEDLETDADHRTYRFQDPVKPKTNGCDHLSLWKVADEFENGV